ncbi:hypothetical protein CISIN_1g021805mg [Citrus sinensis]|uniref:Uncharacterized protein n=1 Tax=Citrus sinensis TaxID=2711 RepID=A0A067F8L3_CITSI|nr:hypothetical protein CISIN_1g021805mg [Citrus sinensis]
MSQLFYTLPKRLTVSPSPPLLHFNYRSSRTRLVCSKMPTESSPSPLTHSITIPSQLSQPVHVVAAPGLSESDFRCAVESTLFKQWLKNLQSETGILANGDMLLKQVLIQGVDMFGKRIGFLKFKADIFCKETGQKVRVPTGRVILELPAGMLDDDKGDFVGTAVREVSFILLLDFLLSL